MRFTILNIAFVFFVGNLLCQTKSVELFYVSSENYDDTTLFLTMEKSSKGISFVFPVREGLVMYTVRNDSILKSDTIPDIQSIYGPYKFKKTAKKILFQNKNISRRYRDLYELTLQEHLSPYLFSSSADSYNIQNRLLDSNAFINIDGVSIACFKFFQVGSDHNPVHDKYYKILYIDKHNLLPFRIEHYLDRKCTWLRSVVFAKTYVKF